MDAPTIAQIQAAALPSESLWAFLAVLPYSQEAQIFYALLLSGTFGIAGHYLFKWLTGEIDGNLWEYLFVNYPKRTALSFVSYIGWIVGLVGTGLFVTKSGDFVGWGIVLVLGLTNGYSVDSLANKTQRKEWTPEKRAATKDDNNGA